MNMSEDLVKKLIDILFGNPYAQFFISLSNIEILDDFKIRIKTDVRLDFQLHHK